MSDHNSRIYKPKEFSQMIGVSVITLQRWDRNGTLKAYRTPTDRRYYTYDQYLKYMGIEENKEGRSVIYARVSSSNQKDDLINQIDFLRHFTNAKGIIIDEVLTDIGSGLNYNRKNWNALIRECQKGTVKTIYITYIDRFIRFGYEWFENFLKECGTEIVVVKNESLSPNEELVQDLISIIHVFSCRIYGLRKYKKAIKEDKDIEESIQDGSGTES